MLLHAFVPTSRANGPGPRAVVYFQGCTLNCSACWNPETHKFRGSEVGVRAVVDLFEDARRSGPLNGVTFSGGEPMQQAGALLALMQEFRNAAPAVSLGMFTGYTECELASGEYLTRPKTTVDRKTALWREVRGLLDFAIMGRYDQTQPATEPLRTSRNQRLVLFSDRYQVGDFGPQLVEVTIGHQGKAVVTGFPVLGVPI
ncbi:MAG: radical SAM protein [Bryobacterales bacterium]|nr:radical SAM protein [Bryobacterales bacterium]